MSSYPPQYPQSGSQFPQSNSQFAQQPGYQSGPPQYRPDGPPQYRPDGPPQFPPPNMQPGPQYSQPNMQQGMKLQPPSQPDLSQGKNWTTALFLCVFFGTFGAHRFYAGKIGTGLLMFFTFGGLGIWRLVDFIMIITGGFTDKNAMPLVRTIKSQGPLQGKDWQVAMLLCLFLGVVGMHRFYVGKNGTGVVMLLTGGGFGIWWLVDFFLLIFDSFTAADDVPLLKRFATVTR